MNVHVANTMVQALTPYVAEALPPGLGREIYLSIRRRLRTESYQSDEHADEIFQRVMVNAYSYLAQHEGQEIRHSRGWLHRIRVNTTLQYLKERSKERDRFDTSTTTDLTELLEGKSQLPDDDSADTNIDLDLVHRAIASLRPSYQEVLRLQSVESLPDSEIQQRMGISSNSYFRKLKCEALKTLRAAILRLSAN